MTDTIEFTKYQKYLAASRQFSALLSAGYSASDVLSAMDAVDAILCGRYVFHWDEPQHPAWLGSWPLYLIRQAAATGALFEAKINPEYKTPQPIEINVSEIPF